MIVAHGARGSLTPDLSEGEGASFEMFRRLISSSRPSLLGDGWGEGRVTSPTGSFQQ